MTTAPKCDMCDKSGLPILLVRDAIAPVGMSAPVAPDCTVEIDPASAHYTKRILRTGYVNLFDEARKRWETYFVTIDGYLRRIPNGYKVPSTELLTPFSCDDRTHRSIAGCITVEKSVAAEIKRQQNHGVQLHGQETRRYVMIADHRVIKNMPSGMTPNQQAKWLAGSLKSINPLEQLQLSRWRSLINSDVGAGLITGILQFASLTKLISDAQKSIANERYDATGRMWVGWLALGGTTAELFGNLTTRAASGLQYGKGIAGIAGKALTVAGKVGGIFGGLVAAGLDGRKAIEAADEQQTGLAWLYGASAFFGAALSLAIGFSLLLGAAAIPIIGILIVLAIAIGIWIEHVKDNAIQDWLERCPWGVLKTHRYPDLKTLQDQLQQACK